MFKVCAIYVAKENYHFDQEYYVSGHLALARKQLEGKVRIKRIRRRKECQTVGWER